MTFSCRHPNLVELKKVVTGKKLDRCASEQACGVPHTKAPVPVTCYYIFKPCLADRERLNVKWPPH